MRFKVNRRPAGSCAWRVPRPARTEGSQALCSVIENMIVTGSLCCKLVVLHVAVGLGSETPLLYPPRLMSDQ